jgi:hypothetical protein
MTSKKPTKKTANKKAPAKKAPAKKAVSKKVVEKKQFASSSSLVSSLVDEVKDNVVYAADVKNPVVKKKFFRWFSR